MYCADCEHIENYFFDATRIWLFLPTSKTFTKAASYCGGGGFQAVQENSHCISVVVDKSELNRFVTGLTGCMERQELANTKITTTSGGDLDLDAFGRIVTGEVFVNRFHARWIVRAIDDKQYESWFQPIVSANPSGDALSVFAHEALFRMRDEEGNIMPPSFVFGLADHSDLLFSLDLVARRSAVECAVKGHLGGKLFINFNPSSIYDPSYCLRSTASAIAELGLQPSDIVFEITETHKVRDINQLKGILAFYRSAGFGVALDDIGSGWSGLNLLHDVRPDFIKVDMDLVRDIDQNSFKQSIVKHLIELAKSNGISVITEGVERLGEAEWLIEAGTDYLQGYLYGRPKAID